MRDSDAPPTKTAEPRSLPHLALTFAIVGAGALVFELAKDFINLQITPWGSHLITIGFSSITVTIAAALIFRRYHQLLRQSHEEVAERQRAEEALATERNRLRAVIDAVPDQIYVKDSQGRFLLVNDSLARALGATKPEEVLGKTDRDFFPADLASQYAADDQRLLQSGEPLVNRDEPALNLPTAASTWQLTTKVPLHNQEGAVVGTVGVSRDISARKRDEEALRLHTRQLEAVRAVNEEITRELDLAALLDLILQRTVDLVGASGGTILFWDETSQVLVPQLHSALFDPPYWQSIPMGRGVVGRVAATRTGLIVNDYQSWPDAIPATLTRPEVTASMAEPLLYRDKLVGVINLVHTQDRAAFTDRDGHILRLLATQVAIAIENARLYAASDQAAREARSLYEVAHSLTTSLDPLEVLHLITEKTRDLLGTSHAQVVLWDKDTRTLQLGAACGADTDQAQRQAYHPGEGLNGIVAQTRTPLIVNDYQAFPGRLKAFTDIVAAIGVPLLYRNRLLGILTSNSAQPGWAFTQHHIALLTSFADQAATALENARLYEAAVHRGEEMEAILRASRTVMAGLDLQTTLKQIAAEASRIARCAQVKVVLVDREAQLLRVGVAHGMPAPSNFPCAIGHGLSGTVAQTGQPLFIADCQSDPRNANTAVDRSLGFRTYLGLPVKAGEEILGVLTFNTTEPRTYSAEELTYLTAFAAQAAIAIENARLYEAMVRRSTEREALLQASRAIESSLDLECVLQAIVHQAAAISAAPVVRLFLLDEDAQLLRCRVAVGFPLDAEPDLVIPVGKSFSGEVAATGKPLAVADTRKDSRTYFPGHIASYGVVSYLGLPVKFQTRLFGVLVFNTPAPRHYTADEITFLAAFAQQAAVAMQNARLFAAAQQAMEDIQRAQAELVRSEKLRALGQMGAGIAHDLNNVLAAILGQVELLKLRVADPEAREGLLTLETAAADGADVVRRLQDFSRPRGATPLVPVALARIVTEALEMTRPRWRDEPQRRGVRIEVHTALADLPPILGHAPEVREALTNLIFNAMDAMPQGGILTLTGTATFEEVGLAITDTGVGMPEEVSSRVFEPFFTTKGLQGTGLGLAVVYGIMERHGGRVAVTSAPGRGTTVTLTFQVAREAEAAPEPPGPAPVTPRRLLIIDDDPMVRQTIVSLLRAVGHFVVEADGGTAGLVRLAETPVDCVLTDLGMPELTGWDVARAVRALHPNLPIVLLTGWGEQAAGGADQQGLVDRVLGKPVRLEELLRVIREVTERSAA